MGPTRFNWFFQYASGSQRGAVPAGTIHCERHEPSLVLLSTDRPLPKGHGFRYQPWTKWQAC